MEKHVHDEQIRQENVMSGNPLLRGQGSDFSVKRRCVQGEVQGVCLGHGMLQGL